MYQRVHPIFIFLPLALLLFSCRSGQPTVDNSESQYRLSNFTYYTEEEVDRGPEAVNGSEGIHNRITYPVFAQTNFIEGEVTVRFIVTKDGTAIYKGLSRGAHPSLDNAAIKAVTNTTFEPAIKDGEKVNAERTFTASFEIPDSTVLKLKEDVIPKSFFGNSGETYHGDEVDQLPYPKKGITHLHKQINYPVAALRQNINGTVWIAFLIDEKGNKGPFKILESVHDLLDAEALNVLESTEFEPAYKDGKPVKAIFTINISFNMYYMNRR